MPYPLEVQKAYPLPGDAPLSGDEEKCQFKSLSDRFAQQGEQLGVQGKGSILSRSEEASTSSRAYANRKL